MDIDLLEQPSVQWGFIVHFYGVKQFCDKAGQEIHNNGICPCVSKDASELDLSYIGQVIDQRQNNIGPSAGDQHKTTGP